MTCQNERSQNRNRESAMLVLESRLLELEIERIEKERAALKGEHVEAGWGNQIRSYVLQPYKMVKDLRTSAETSDTAAVLDGDLDPFIQAYLRSPLVHVGDDAVMGRNPHRSPYGTHPVGNAPVTVGAPGQITVCCVRIHADLTPLRKG